jgi:adenine phosphoribosyltransferase
MTIEQLKASVRDVPDFPKPGILFKDITVTLKKPEALHFTVDKLYDYYKDKNISKVAGIESRGLILGSILAYRLGAGFVPVRKAGKLPAATLSMEYALEYGVDKLEIHCDAIEKGDVVLLHDDLLATGGSAATALALIRQFEPAAVFANFMIELRFLNGRKALSRADDIFSLIKY